MAHEVRLIRSPVSVTGMVLTTISAVVFLVVFLADLFGMHTNPYMGILFFLVLPSIFLFGLFLIPLGAWIERRRRERGLAPNSMHWPRIDLNDPTQRRTAIAVFALSIANIVIVSLAAYRGIEYMDSVQFCGQVCHQVMKPEFNAHQDSAHSRVACVQCHIGPGASYFTQSKLSGTRQIFAVTFNTFDRPIKSPVANLRPARDVCEQCHWPEKFHGDVVRRVKDYADDEKNTETETVLDVHVGSGSDRLGASGITTRSQLRELAGLRQQVQDRVDAMSIRVGELNAHVIRLDALGKRLTQMANITSGELNFDAAPALGGPEEESVGASAEIPDLTRMMDDVQHRLERRDAQLLALENVILSRALTESIRPEGRPVMEGYISSYFGGRPDPFDGHESIHKGVDFAGTAGEQVLAVAAGVVTRAEPASGYGNLVEINHGNGYVTRYGHNQSLLVAVGDTVVRGQPVALMGSTGRSTGPHVHFEVLRNGSHINPLSFIDP